MKEHATMHIITVEAVEEEQYKMKDHATSHVTKVEEMKKSRER